MVYVQNKVSLALRSRALKKAHAFTAVKMPCKSNLKFCHKIIIKNGTIPSNRYCFEICGRKGVQIN
jgi:hypothetical protein